VRLLSHPIITTTASLPDSPVESDPYDIELKFKPHLDLVIDGGKVAPAPSSVISLIDDVPEIIREGKGDISVFA
jgi:tRNA A37 threonylcarbamoyladenosine synthetase subunit TsaC/SUA5/YrdC